MPVPSSADGSAAADLPSVIVLGEILWDIFPESRRLGGAPLNFATHARALGHRVSLISSLGDDALGREARTRIDEFDLDTALLEDSSQFATGTAKVDSGPNDEPVFSIARPAAYDAIELSTRGLEHVRNTGAGWFYFGTLLAATAQGLQTLERLLDVSRDATRFLDLNLRPGADSLRRAIELLRYADVVKLNESEFESVRQFTGLPRSIREFCHAACEHFEWQAVCITRGSRGCAMLVGDEFAESPGVSVVVADTVGAGDAFAAAFMHGLSRQWTAERIGAFANRLGASVAARAGSLPEPGIHATQDPHLVN